MSEIENDHRILGPQLGLFHIQEEAVGSVFWHPKGWTLWRIIENYIRDTISSAGYQEIRTPQLVDKVLWEQSGHWEKYRDAIFVTETEKRTYGLKPMNCPCHIQVFKQGTKSYRDLPLRLAEFGCCHRNEPSGSMHGLMRLRGFTQDDAHIFCTEDQIKSEVFAFNEMLTVVYRDFGFNDIKVRLATRPKESIGTDEQWIKAESALKDAMAGMLYEDAPGEGAFYGPKLEYHVMDSMGRSWQLGTIQVDFALPDRLGAKYIGEDNKEHVPVMLHRAILGSMERFIGILIEHYAGALPCWLSPVQAVVMSISDKSNARVKAYADILSQDGVRVETDIRSERINLKIRDAQLRHIPYMAVIGEKDAEGMASIRHRSQGQLDNMPWLGLAANIASDEDKGI